MTPRTGIVWVMLIGSAASAAAQDSGATLVHISASRLSRGPHASTVALQATVARVKDGDSLRISVISFARCADATAMRTDEHRHVFDRAAAERTVATQIAVPKAARYEVSFELTSSSVELEHTRTTSAFTTIQEETCK